jgi:hypothetical protein
VARYINIVDKFVEEVTKCGVQASVSMPGNEWRYQVVMNESAGRVGYLLFGKLGIRVHLCVTDEECLNQNFTIDDYKSALDFVLTRIRKDFTW